MATGMLFERRKQMKFDKQTERPDLHFVKIVEILFTVKKKMGFGLEIFNNFVREYLFFK